MAAEDFNLMALNLGLGLGSTSLILLTTSFKGTSWGSSDAARSYDAQRPVLLPLLVAGRHPVVDNLRHDGVRVRGGGGPAVASAAAWTQQ